MFAQQRNDSRRLHIAVPVRLVGRDRAGRSFNREAWTLNVSSGGAAIEVPEDLALPDQFHLMSQDYQFQADADVAIVWSRERPQRAVGVRLVSKTSSSAWLAR